MPSLGRREFTDNEGNRYVLDIEFDDAAIMEDKLVTSVFAKRVLQNENGDDLPEDSWPTIEAKLSLLVADRIVILELPERDPIILHLGDNADAFFDDDHDFDQESEMADFIAGMFESGGAIDRAGDLIDFIPAGEPVLGCLIKAGISTTLGQMVQCYHQLPVERAETTKQKIWQMLRCLGVNGHVMLAKAGLRTLRCWLTAGFV
jgi:hypothetical protein